jgi:fatty-acyl-CoA synthase
MSAPRDWLSLHARLTPERLAAEDLTHHRRWTYAGLHMLVSRFAAHLRMLGVRSGERVAVLARNRVEQIALHLGCARIGAIYAPLNWRLATAELKVLIGDCEPALILGDDFLERHGLVGLDIDRFHAEALQCEPIQECALDLDEPSLLLYTSGTSGAPKGVLLSENNILQTAINSSILCAVKQDSAFLCDTPMFHIIGIVTNIRPALLRGARVLVSDGFDPVRTLARLSDDGLGVTHYFCVPQMAAALRAVPGFDPRPLQRLMAIFTGGAPQPAPNIRAWLDDGIAIVDGFGMSEVGTVFGMPLDRAEIAKRAGSVGVATPNMETRIVDANGRACAPGVPGELQVRGANVARGYWRRPELERQAFAAGGWFRTGDIAKCDDNGFYWIVDRQKDMFISGGENVYPAEIEAALADCEGVAECAAIGVPDEKWGEVGWLFVVAKQDVRLDANQVLSHLAGRVARFKLPKQICFVTELPRSGPGKVNKTKLRAAFDARRNADP